MRKLWIPIALGLLIAACGGGGGADAGQERQQASSASGYLQRDAAGEPYLVRCGDRASRIVLFLHTWSGDMRQVEGMYPDGVPDACVVSPNFNGPNSTPQALGSDDSLARIDRAVKHAQGAAGLQVVDVLAASGGTMAALNYIGKYGGVRRASLWLVIHDLESLYNSTQDQQLKTDMAAVLGGPPAPNDQDYLARSPRARLDGALPPLTVFLNTGSADTSTPKAQGEAARAQLEAKGITVVYREWPIAHVFGAAQEAEAVRQISSD